jgi:hypothetical protein
VTERDLNDEARNIIASLFRPSQRGASLGVRVTHSTIGGLYPKSSFHPTTWDLVLKTVAKHEDPNAGACVLSSYYMPRAIYETESPSRTLIGAVYVFAPEVPKGRAD